MGGWFYKEKGFIHYLNPINKEIRMKIENTTVVRIKFTDIIVVVVIEE